jgi:hypothetical protein
MSLEHLEEMQRAAINSGADQADADSITAGTRVADVLPDSVAFIQLLEKLRVPVRHYIAGGSLSEDGKVRLRAIGDLNADPARAEALLRAKDLYAELSFLDIDRLVCYERLAG